MKPFLILQSRPEDDASDDEYAAFLRAGQLEGRHARRIRMDQEGLPRIVLEEFSGVIIGGGPFCVSDTEKTATQLEFEPRLTSLLAEIIKEDFPCLGACYGNGVLVQALGGEVSKEKYGEGLGAITVELNDEGRNDPLLQDIDQEFRAFGGHKEAVQILPEHAVLLGGSHTCPVQVIRVKNNIYGTQFHPELDTAGLTLRIHTYKNAGYFPPQDADQLISLAANEKVTEPEKMLLNFVSTYKTSV